MYPLFGHDVPAPLVIVLVILLFLFAIGLVILLLHRVGNEIDKYTPADEAVRDLEEFQVRARRETQDWIC